VLDQVDAMRARLRNEVQGSPGKWTEGLQKFLTAYAPAASIYLQTYR
jgi:hypothetical protein